MKHSPKTNILQLRPTDNFVVSTGIVDLLGEVIEKEQVGSACMKPGESFFRLNIWMLAQGSYCIVRDRFNHSKYSVLAHDEIDSEGKPIPSNFRRVGVGEVVGCFIRIKIHLLQEELFLSLFPENELQQAVEHAV